MNQSTRNTHAGIYSKAETAKIALLVARRNTAAQNGDDNKPPAWLNQAEKKIWWRMRQLGYRVECVSDLDSRSENADGKAVVFISATADPKAVDTKFRDVETPVIVSNYQLFPKMGMTEPRPGKSNQAMSKLSELKGRLRLKLGLTLSTALNYGPIQFGTDTPKCLRIIDSDTARNHPMAARFSGEIEFSLLQESVTANWGKPNSRAIKIAAPANQDASAAKPAGDDEMCVIFGYESGKFMFGLNAPARRVGFFLAEQTAMRLTPQAWVLFDAAIGWATAESAKTFDSIYRREWRELKHRRAKQSYPEIAAELKGNKGTNYNAALPISPPPHLAGLALSGGGIRSATFSLGWLKGLQDSGWLRLFDYLSTVSGGGFTGGWWSAWLSRSSAILPETVLNDERAPGKEETEFWIDQLRLKPEALTEEQSQSFLRGLLPQNQNRHRLSQFIFAGLPKETREKLGRAGDQLSKGNPEALSTALLKEVFEGINSRWINKPDDPSEAHTDEARKLAAEKERNAQMYSWNRFYAQGISLTRQTYQLAESKPTELRLRQLNRLLLEEAYPRELGCGFFPPPEQIEPERNLLPAPEGRIGEADDEQVNASRSQMNDETAPNVLSAGKDPVHHLRLFSNYLVPRRGVLSADSWSAISYLTRNMGLTWLILLPILLVLVLVGQLYFLVWGDSYNHFIYPCLPWHSAWPRVERAGYLLMLLAGWIALLTAGWMAAVEKGEAFGNKPKESLANRCRAWLRRLWNGPLWIRFLSWATLGLMLLIVVISFAGRLTQLQGGAGDEIANGSWARLAIIFLIGGVLIWVLAWRVRDGAAKKEETSKVAVRRSQIMRLHSGLLMCLVVAAVVLAVAGFGPDLMDYVLRNGDGWVENYVKKSGGILALLTAAGGAIFTAIKGAPVGGGDRAPGPPSPASGLILKLAPPLVVLVLAVIFSWVTRNLIYQIAFDDVAGKALMVATCVGIMLGFFIVLIETQWQHPSYFRFLLSIWAVFTLWGAAVLVDYLICGRTEKGSVALWRVVCNCDQNHLEWVKLNAEVAWLGWVFLFCAAVAGFLLLWRFASVDSSARGEGAPKRRKRWAFYLAPGWILSCASVTVLFLSKTGALQRPRDIGQWFPVKMTAYLTYEIFAGVGLVMCLLLAVFEAFGSYKRNLRARYLLAGLYLMLVALFAIGMSPKAEVSLAAFGLIGVLLTWVVALGWMADPNLLSLHLFYRSRLVRAYLGASNPQRSRSRKDISQIALGDDVMLDGLENCYRGGPYHLVNTTLNLIGGSDLATAQRSAAPFLLSKNYCGSLRTGYRDTREYMSGRMTLGTAVAVSGAAASPSVASIGTTAAQGMLLTLLNVRLGFWAPTPNKDYWQDPQARLWPFLTLREFMSQTNDLAAHCYLTDGAHFDNTGIYSLVERGCKLIVAADCGADASLQFGDLGNVIRRCRIDFGAEIAVDVKPLFKNEKGKAEQHFAVGTIRYSREHFEKLHYYRHDDNEKYPAGSEEDRELRTGAIVLFKPALVGDETADVLQYGIEKSGSFPQQTTADQFYDEAQFESYRRLGELSVRSFIDALEKSMPAVKKHNESLKYGGGITTTMLDDIFKSMLNGHMGGLTKPVIEKEFD